MTAAVPDVAVRTPRNMETPLQIGSALGGSTQVRFAQEDQRLF